jgi:UDP-glucose 4-epimerase
MENILVTGGAGYVGSYVCKTLSKKGYQPVVLDNFVHGHHEAVKWGPFIEGDISDRALLEDVFSTHDIRAVMHFGGFCYVGDSVRNPRDYYRNNVTATLNLLEAMIDSKIPSFIFSSSCTVYGEPEEFPIKETHPTNPINPYGRCKLMVEQILNDFSRAYGLNYISLRYFNAAGADPDGELGEDHRPETHLIPLVLQTALGQQKEIEIYGDNYPTKDGTCIRDYIHIDDLAQAHVLGLERMLKGQAGGIYNLGNEIGHSVKEVIQMAGEVTGCEIPFRGTERRPGDPPVLIGSSRKAMAELKWAPRFGNLRTIIETAWQWHKTHPNGYSS